MGSYPPPAKWKVKARHMAQIGHMTASIARATKKRWEHAEEAVNPELAKKRAEQRKARARARYAHATEAEGRKVRPYAKGVAQRLAKEYAVSPRTIRDWIKKGKIHPE